MFSNSIDLMSQTLHIDDAVLVNRTSNQDIILQGNLLLVDFAITMLASRVLLQRVSRP